MQNLSPLVPLDFFNPLKRPDVFSDVIHYPSAKDLVRMATFFHKSLAQLPGIRWQLIASDLVNGFKLSRVSKESTFTEILEELRRKGFTGE